MISEIARSFSTTPVVVLVINSLAGRGGERSVLTLAQGFVELGCDVHLMCFSKQLDYDVPSGVSYHLVEFGRWKYKFWPTREIRYRVFCRAVDSYVINNISSNPDLVLSNLIQQNRILSHSRIKNMFYVVRNTLSKEYGSAIKKNKKKFLDKFTRMYSKHPCVCVSRGVERDLVETLGKITKTITIYNPFDKPYMERMASAFIPEHKDYIVHLGAFTHAKAHDVLLKAYAKSDKRYALLLLGKGKLESEIKDLANRLQISDDIIFMGFHKNPYPFIKNARFLVLSSRFEGFVRVVMESIALGTPAISTNCPSGPSEMLPKHNLVDVDDVDALARKMNEAMHYPEDFIVPFDEKFLPKNIARQYLDLLN